MLAFIQGSEWLIIGLAVLLLFGAKKLPELARGLGKGIREFKKASSDIGDELNRPDYEDDYDRPRRRKRPIEDRQEKRAQAEVEEEPKTEKAKSTSESKD